MAKPKVNWISLDREWPTVAGWCWVTRNNGKNIELCKYDPEDNLRFYNVTYWAKVEYPEPPEEGKEVSELEKWARAQLSDLPQDYILRSIAQQTARKLIEVMEERMNNVKRSWSLKEPFEPELPSSFELLEHIKQWCGEV